MRKTIVASLFLLFVLAQFAGAQTSSQLRARLGKTSSETFRVEPDLTVRADYDEEGEVCRMQLTGRYFDIVKLSEILIPKDSRGREIQAPKGSFSQTNSYSMTVYEYEKVTLQVYSRGGSDNLNFTFKERVCAQKSPVATNALASINNFAPNSQRPSTKTETFEDRTIYGKYETTQPALITDLPLPELTPEAIADFQPDEMTVEVVLSADGKVSVPVLRGYLKKGMGDRVSAAVAKIKFVPAKINDRSVSQRVTIKYGIKKCKNGKPCTYAFEFVE